MQYISQSLIRHEPDHHLAYGRYFNNDTVEQLLEETLEAYHHYTQAGGPHVGDYAEFATQSLNCFQRALKNPHLSTDELAWALRRCSRLKRAAKEAGISWATLTAAALSGQNGYRQLSDF